MNVEGSVAVVTGGASGLGEGVVRMMADGGGRAVILDLPNSRGQEIADELGAVRAQPGQGVLEVVDGEHDAVQADRVRRGDLRLRGDGRR